MAEHDAPFGPVRLTLWDARIAGRAAAIAALSFAVAWLVTASTDEGGLAWGVRFGRSLPVAPACAAVGAALALAPARARGEIRALESLGRSPFDSALPAVLGGAAVVIAAALVVAFAPSIDVDGFFPATRHAAALELRDGAFVDPVRGWRVEPTGALTRIAPLEGAARALGAVPPHGRGVAAIVMAVAGIALALFTAHALVTRAIGEGGGDTTRASLAGAIAFVFACALGSVLGFHAAAAGRVPAPVATLPALVMLGGALLRYRPLRWPTVRG